MSVATEIQRLNTAKAGIKSALEAKGVTVDTATTLDGYPQLVSSIPSGGGDEINGLVDGTLTGFTVPSGVTTIRSYLFNDCKNLEYVNLHTGVTTFGAACFKSATNLTAVTNADSVTSIGNECFRGASKLETIENLVLGNVNEYAFNGCFKLSIPIVITGDSVASNSFANCHDIPKYTFKKACNIGNQFTTAGYSIFLNNTGCTEWDFSDTWAISNLQNTNHFNGCSGSIKIPAIMAETWTASTTPLGTTCKWGSIPISGNILTVENKYPSITVSYTTTGGTKISVARNSLSDYNSYGFGLIKNDYDATTGGTMVLYGPSAYTPALGLLFAAKPDLLSVDLSNVTGLTKVSNIDGAFGNCYYLTGVTFNPSTPVVIPDTMFGNCYRLQSVVGLNAETIPYATFRNCSALTSFDFTNVRVLGREAFYNCSSLTSVTLNLTTMDDTGSNGNQFRNCTGLTTVTVNCPTIAGYAFAQCTSLTSVTIGADVELMLSSVFERDTILTELRFLGTTPPQLSGGSQFYYVPDGTIYCPASAVETYTTWKNSGIGLSGWTVQAIS